MIAIQLSGGLGNQMFQFASAYALARRLNTSLHIDSSEFQKEYADTNYTKRNFELDVFPIKFNKINPIIWKFYRRLSAGVLKLGLFTNRYLVQVYVEKSLSFDARLLSMSGNYYLVGYFQSEKYFMEYREDIRKIFQFKNDLTGPNRDILDSISKNNSVSVHIRRGDYVSNTQINDVHGIVSVDYYTKAAELIRKKVVDPVFYFFSDDAEWVRNNFNLGSQVIISHNIGDNSYRDLQLMTYCKHNIIANSTFSWWGAWLNGNPNKIVIAPSKWFGESRNNSFAADLIPDTWTRLSTE